MWRRTLGPRPMRHGGSRPPVSPAPRAQRGPAGRLRRSVSRSRALLTRRGCAKSGARGNALSVLALDDEERPADRPGQLRLLAGELEPGLELLGHLHAVGQLEPDGALAGGVEGVHDVDGQAALV